ncbi:class I SAM-dependent methyltransferase [Streptomyces chattanoogensis]|uniref:class I SAM-dependent methyltransferase n=1 Tax=Streptomyces chattanoogensis TaxID=66876 RepID=UPI0036883122
MDVGCGTGALARDLARARATRANSTESARIRYIEADVLNTDLAPEAYDVVACLATVHHMPFVTAINKLLGALAPGGVLLFLGLFRDSTPTDLAVSLAAVPAELAVGGTFRIRCLLCDRGRPRTTLNKTIPTTSKPTATTAQLTLVEPQMTISEVRNQTAALLPGCSIHRHLFWRYSLVCCKSAY